MKSVSLENVQIVTPVHSPIILNTSQPTNESPLLLTTTLIGETNNELTQGNILNQTEEHIESSLFSGSSPIPNDNQTPTLEKLIQNSIKPSMNLIETNLIPQELFQTNSIILAPIILT